MEPDQKEFLIEMVRRATSDDVRSWRMTADGWVHTIRDAEGNLLADTQEELMARARATVADRR